jgi:hypothetical protein
MVVINRFVFIVFWYSGKAQPCFVQACLGRRRVNAKPRTLARVPPITIQIALSVGDLVKNLETSEVKEFVAFTP